VKRLLIATDAWRPQVNGVVRTLERMTDELPRLGVAVAVLAPDAFPTFPCPTYPEIRLALTSQKKIAAEIEAVGPDAIHIATEGPVGVAVRRWCLRHHRVFTTSYHTRFPEYLAERAPVPLQITYALLRRFHNAGAACMVATQSLERDLRARGFRNLLRWPRGVDCSLFRPRDGAALLDLPRPVFLYVGRVSVEKNVGAFLGLDLPGSKVVIGDGPALPTLRAAHPEARFFGVLAGEALAEVYAQADVFVFPSRTDTFGIVLLEALASGVPVAAFPVAGPADVLGSAKVGVLDRDLRTAAIAALDIPPERCRTFALAHTWEASARRFLDNILAVYGSQHEMAA